MSFPSRLLLVWLAAELVHLFLRCRMHWRSALARRVILWTLRPWAGWAAINMVFRHFPALLQFNNPLTFPFFADFWETGAGLPWTIEWLPRPHMWMWGCLALCFATLLITRVCRLMARETMTRAQMIGTAACLYVISLGFTLTANTLPLGAGGNKGSLLSPWLHSGSTMVFDMHVIRSPARYLSDFTHYQARVLNMHSISHPPGASLSLYWIGQAFLQGRQPPLWCYALGLASLATLNLLLVFNIGRHVTGRLAGGWLASALWSLSPSAVIYNVFAMESYYALFYNAALLMMLYLVERQSPRFPPPAAVMLGMLFAAIAMLNYSWCLLTTVFTLFLCWSVWSRHMRAADAFRRWAAVLAVFALFWFGFLAIYDIDYLHAFLYARRYVSRFYRFVSLFDGAIAFVGGQWVLYLMMGPMACSAFIAWLASRVKARTLAPPLALYLCILAVYLGVILMMNPLKIEAARQFSWMITLPLAFASHNIICSRNPRRLAAAAMATSAAATLLMRIYLVFWA